MSGFPGCGLGSYLPLTHGNPGWRFWALLVGFFFVIWLAVKLFYRA